MTEADLALYPAIRTAYESLHPRPDLNGFISWLHALDAGRHEIQRVNEQLARLLERHPASDLEEQCRALFGDMDDWQKALTEVLGLAHLERHGVLESVGWPRGGTSTPPFEGRLLEVLGPQPVPFDVKPALKSGTYLLQDNLEDVLKEWAESHRIPPVQLELTCHGCSTQPIVGRHVRYLADQFRSALAGHGWIPSNPISLNLPNLTVSVAISQDSGCVVHRGMSLVGDQETSVAGIVLGHLRKKAPQADQLNSLFVLVYIRPPGAGGSDVNPRDLGGALRELEGSPELTAILGHQRWLGTVMIDWTPVPLTPASYVQLRPAADWRGASCPSSVLESLNPVAFPQ